MAEKGDRQSFVESRERQIRVGDFNPNESIFKYVSLGGNRSWNYFERTFNDFELIGSSINSLNDPYEGKPRFLDDLNRESLRQCCDFFDKSGGARTTSDFKSKSFVVDSKELIDAKLEATHRDARILSFCRRSDSHLLWSHYANSHKGVCIHFSVGAFEQEHLSIGSVTYTRYRPVVPKSLLGKIAIPPEKSHHPHDRLALRKELYRPMFFTKPLDWEYEEEFRVIYQTSKMTNVPFNPEKVYEVILGAKCPEEDENRIKEILNNSSSKVILRRAVIDEDTFAVSIS
ncbi:MAG: DUF2971 domain-containing protein [Erythrobacter sp.]